MSVTAHIQTRVFLIGCPRSGTTLLQSLLAANSHIASFPETHFFERLFGRPLLTALGVVSRHARPHWNAFIENIGHPEMQHILPRGSLLVCQYSGAFLHVLDTLTLEQGKAVWLEKTPGHLRFAHQIEKLVDSVRFVHILRNGLDTIASMYELGQRYPEGWGPEYSTLDGCIERWVVDMRLSKKYASKENHRLVRYEQLTSDPRPTLVELCEFIGVPFEEQMLTDYSTVATQVILEKEPWKAEVYEPIRAGHRSKFNTRLDKTQRQYVIAHVPEDLRGILASESVP